MTHAASCLYPEQMTVHVSVAVNKLQAISSAYDDRDK